MFSKNKQGEWEVKIPSVRILEGHPLLLCWVVLCVPVQCALFATHMKVKLKCGVCMGCNPPCKIKLFETLKSLSMHCHLSPNTTKCRGWGGFFLSLW